jgi:hypothetical protein
VKLTREINQESDFALNLVITSFNSSLVFYKKEPLCHESNIVRITYVNISRNNLDIWSNRLSKGRAARIFINH